MTRTGSDGVRNKQQVESREVIRARVEKRTVMDQSMMLHLSGMLRGRIGNDGTGAAQTTLRDKHMRERISTQMPLLRLS